MEAKTEACCNVIHEDTVDKVKAAELPEEQVSELATIFQALGDTTRVRIIHALVQSEMCVCDLAAVLGMTQSAISHQLRTLRNLRIIKRRKEGRVAYYSIDDHHILTLFKTGLEHVSHR
ncbi:ArsR family transcriptional regulator [Tumebacillus sp. BK434]|nr:ArsR family transcriptional regulator [Tumebacillus sp. BK434]